MVARHNRTLFVLLSIFILTLLVGCRTSPSPPTSTPPLTLHSDAFAFGATIPRPYTCDGRDVSPSLTWDGIPQGTRSFALIVDDPDAPRGPFVHWVLFNIPAGRTTLPEGVPPQPEVPGIGLQGHNDFGVGVLGYRGPCPPPGKPHRYVFHLYALDTSLHLRPGIAATDLRRMVKGHVLAYGEYMGRYARGQ